MKSPPQPCAEASESQPPGFSHSFAVPNDRRLSGSYEKLKAANCDGERVAGLPPAGTHLHRRRPPQQVKWQERFDMKFDPDEARRALNAFARDFGYSDEERSQFSKPSQSKEIADIIRAHKTVAKQQIRTVKLPTILFNGRRYDRVVARAQLK